MSAGKLVLKIRCYVQNKFNPAIFVIIIFGLINYATCEIAPKLDDDPTAGEMKSFDSNHDTYNSINNNKEENLHNNGGTKSSIPLASDVGFIHAFIASISVILVSELGDKTFFIAAIMAMRHPRLTVFGGAILALALMTVLSAVFGMAATIIPRVYTYYISTALFAIFGLKMLKDAYYMSPTEGQIELEEVQSNLRQREDELMKSVRKDRRKDDDGDNLNFSISNNRRMSGWKKNSNSDEYNDDNVTKAMISKSMTSNGIIDRGGSGSGSIGEIMISDSTRRTQSTSNLKSTMSLHEMNTNSFNSLEEGIDASPSLVPSTSAAINNGDINANGMELRRLEREATTTSIIQDPESGVIRKVPKRGAYYLAMRIFMQAFTMTFLAEWGDRSQLTTIILGARENIYGVIVGGVLGHSVCTGLAVIGGRMVAQKISVRTVTFVGGIVFLMFAISALFFDPNAE